MVSSRNRTALVAAFILTLVSIIGASALDVQSDLWSATDALGRKLPSYRDCGPPKSGKYVGIFYFLWLGQHGTGGPYDITRLLAQNSTNPAWGPVNAFHHWGESELGYYLSNDAYVMKKHARMLSDAGVDVLIIDVTNAFTYKDNYLLLCSTFKTLKNAGEKVPQICFITNSYSDTVVQTLYNDFYSQNLYPDLWFMWLGKPLILASPGNLPQNIKDFFTFRQSWAWHDSSGWFGNGQDKWPWLDNYPQAYGWHTQGVPEEISVCVAQHPTSNIGRSFQNGVEPDPASLQTDQGLCFTEQWKRALEVNPDFIYVTGWNEWVAQRFLSDGSTYFLGQRLPSGGTYFVDEYNQEYSRDIEPMKGGHGDNYYYQMIANIRKYKGVRPPEVPSAPKTISIDSSFTDWTDVSPEYLDHAGDTEVRNSTGWGSAGTYTNTTGRNDFTVLKVARDSTNVYFYAQTNANITTYSGTNWMLLFIDSDCSSQTGWHGYDYLLNLTGKTSTTTMLKRNSGGTWSWTDVGTVTYRRSLNKMEIKIPRSYLGYGTGTDLAVDFHWADNIQKTDDITEFSISGDSAPDRRANYHFNTAPPSVTALSASPGTSQVSLSWTNPLDFDTAGAMVRYKTTGYPTDPNDGTLLADLPASPGSAGSFLHAPAAPTRMYYYTVFACDTSGEFSPGVNVRARPFGPVFISQYTFDTNSEGWQIYQWRSGTGSFGVMTWTAGAGKSGGGMRCSGAGDLDTDDRSTREGGEMRRTISTSGYKNIRLFYDLRVGSLGSSWSGTGTGTGTLDHNDVQEQLTVYYSTDGGFRWVEAAPWLDRSTLLGCRTYGTRTIDLSGIPGANDNPLFALRFRWQLNSKPEMGDYADIDNIVLTGDPITSGSIGNVKKAADSRNVYLDGGVLYINRGTFGYVEDTDRSGGIKIKGSLSGSVGDLVFLQGTLGTESTGERFVNVREMCSDGTATLEPLGTNNRSIAGRVLDGLYVTVWGKVKPGSLTSDSFVITDGSDPAGIKVVAPGAPTVTEGEYISVSGAAGYDGARVIYQR